MPIAVVMPKLGMTMQEGTVIEWPLEIGARVIARGTLADPSACGEGKDVTIRITNIRRGIGG